MMRGNGTIRPLVGSGVTLVDDPVARRLVKEAHSRMYKWPAGFGGYRADVRLNEEGRIVNGTVRLTPGKDMIVDLLGADPALQEWARERLWTQGMHLAHSPFKEVDGTYVRYAGYGEKKLVV